MGSSCRSIRLEPEPTYEHDPKFTRLCERLDEAHLVPELDVLDGRNTKLEFRVRHPPSGKIIARALFDPARPNRAATVVAEQLMEFDL